MGQRRGRSTGKLAGPLDLVAAARDGGGRGDVRSRIGADVAAASQRWRRLLARHCRAPGEAAVSTSSEQQSGGRGSGPTSGRLRWEEQEQPGRRLQTGGQGCGRTRGWWRLARWEERKENPNWAISLPGRPKSLSQPHDPWALASLRVGSPRLNLQPHSFRTDWQVGPRPRLCASSTPRRSRWGLLQQPFRGVRPAGERPRRYISTRQGRPDHLPYLRARAFFFHHPKNPTAS